MGTYYIVTQDGIFSVGGFERKGISKFAFIVMLIVHTTYMQLQSSTYLHYYSTCTVVCRRRWTGTDDKMRCNEARESERDCSHTSCIVNYGSGNIKPGNLQAVDVMVELSSPSRLVLAGWCCCWSFSVTSPSFYLPCHRSRKVNYVLSLICCSVDYTIIPWPTTRMTTYTTRPVSPTSHHVTIL